MPQKATINLVGKARNGIATHLEDGMIVYYYRMNNGTRYQAGKVGYRGPVRLIALEPDTTRNGTYVVWHSHGGNLIRGTPEHIMFA